MRIKVWENNTQLMQSIPYEYECGGWVIHGDYLHLTKGLATAVVIRNWDKLEVLDE